MNGSSPEFERAHLPRTLEVPVVTRFVQPSEADLMAPRVDKVFSDMPNPHFPYSDTQTKDKL
jgi:hypothetical protein